MDAEFEIQELRQELKLTKSKLRDIEYEFKNHKMIFEEIIESSLAGYFDINYVTGKTIMSPKFKSMFGYNDIELPNNQPNIWKKYLHPKDLPGVEKLFMQHVESKGEVKYSNEVRYFHKNGSIVWVYCKGRVIEWTEEGKPLRLVGCHINITPLKAALEVVAAQKDELVVKNRELEQFASVVSHDLKEPLRTITSFIDLYREQYACVIQDERANEYLNFVEKSSYRMSNLIDALLDYTKIGWEPKKKKADLNEIVENVIEDVKLLIVDSNATYKVKKLPKINVYPTELSNLFQNLISNAIKFSKTDETPYFEISALKKGGMWEFKIQDNGIGIDESHFERIFIIFKRLKKVKGVDGEGVGLAQCKKIIDLHKGKIWVESEEGKGSTFYFTIPTR